MRSASKSSQKSHPGLGVTHSARAARGLAAARVVADCAMVREAGILSATTIATTSVAAGKEIPHRRATSTLPSPPRSIGRIFKTRSSHPLTPDGACWPRPGVPVPLAAQVVIVLVALLHLYFLVLEMFLWDKPTGLRVFRNTPEKAAITKVLAANQGLYNGFLAAGLLWSLWLGAEGRAIAIFFLDCVIIAGVFGAATVSKRILYIQALPAALALTLLFLSPS